MHITACTGILAKCENGIQLSCVYITVFRQLTLGLQTVNVVQAPDYLKKYHQLLSS